MAAPWHVLMSVGSPVLIGSLKTVSGTARLSGKGSHVPVSGEHPFQPEAEVRASLAEEWAGRRWWIDGWRDCWEWRLDAGHRTMMVVDSSWAEILLIDEEVEGR